MVFSIRGIDSYFDVKTMEYTFKNSLRGKASTVLLTDYCLTIQSVGKEEDIPYANITAVRLSRLSKRTYQLFLYPDNHSPIKISNHYYLSTKEMEDRSRQYATFVRVLHLHLIEKSTAEFTSGWRMTRMVAVGIGALFATISMALMIHYYSPAFMNALLVFLGTCAVAVGVILVINKDKQPKFYLPTDIPLEFLP